LITGTVPDGVRYVPNTSPAYVSPPLLGTEEELQEAQVVVVSAPAAVGKSQLARFLASRTNGVLWDLAQARVGNNYAIGTLAMSHGSDVLSETIQAIQTGEFLIIADALDEARLRVNFDSFTSFLDDLSSQLLKGVPWGKPAVVLLAREETADFTTTWLRDDLRLKVAAIEIDFFGPEDARVFIDRQLQSLGADAGNTAIRAARDLLLSRTETILTRGDEPEPSGEEAARRFLGYAPVLVASARYLASDANPQRIVERLTNEVREAPVWTFLVSLIGDLLLREQTKFINGFKSTVQTKAATLNFNEWDSLFSPAEQCQWLVRERLGQLPPSVSLDQDLEVEYRAAVTDFLAQHPFVGASLREFASPAFEDYVYAAILIGDDQGASDAVRARVADAEYRPTEMLGRFAVALANGPLLAEILPAIYESFVAAGQIGALQLIEEDDGEMHAHIQLPGESLAFDLIAGGEPLQFVTTLRAATVFSRNSEVHLGVGGRLFVIGPETVIVAPKIVVHAESLFADDRDSGLFSALVIGGSLTASDPSLRFVANSGAGFRARTDEVLRYPFAGKALGEMRVPAVWDDASRNAAAAFFRMATFFKREGYEGGLGSYAEPIDRLASRHPATAAVLAVAIEQGVIVSDGNLYRFSPEVVALDYTAVRDQRVTNEAAALFAAAAEKMRPGPGT
jgi:hypothetical protein